MTTALLAARLLLALVFTVAAVAKMLDLPGSRAAVQGFGVPERFAGLIGSLLPLAELIIAGLLLPRATAVGAAAGALLLLIAFTGAIAVALARGRQPDCHCFGQLHSTPAGWATVGRDLALAAVAGFAVVGGQNNPGASALGWPGDVGPIAVVGIAGGVLLAAVLAFQSWFSLQLLRQSGRLVLRLDAIERMLAADVRPQAQAPAAPALPAGPLPGLHVGELAPGFSLPRPDGETITLDGLRARGLPVMLFFSDPGCGPCNALLPTVAEWQRTHEASMTIALVSRGDLELNRAKAVEHGITNVLLQSDREVASQYQAVGTPAAVLVDRGGRIASPLAQGAGAIEAVVRQAVTDSRALLPVHQSNGQHRTGAPNHGPDGGDAAHGAQTDVAANVRQPAPAVWLEDLDGRPVRLADFAGRHLVVLFWNPHCGFCQRMLPELRAWEADRASSAPELLVISSGEREINLAMGLASRLGLDETFEAGRAFGATGTPSAVAVDSMGRIATPLAMGQAGVMSLLNTATAYRTL